MYDINEQYNIHNLADLDKVKKEFDSTMSQIREILQLVFDKNEWLIINSNNIKVLNKLKSVQAAIDNYFSSSSMFDILTTQVKPLIVNSTANDDAKVLSIITSMTKEDREEMEYELLHGTRGIQSELLWKTFQIGSHYEETDRHKDLLYVSYSELQNYCYDASIVDIIFHDWTKYLFDLSIGYTWKWIHSQGRREMSKPMVNHWKAMLTTGAHTKFFFTCLSQTWGEAVRLHYTSEDHHPQFFGLVKDKKRKDLTESGKEESLIDMCARELFNQIDCEKDIGALKSLKYIKFDTKYLGRYNDNDLRKVIKIILLVLKENVSDSEYKDKELYYNNFLNNLHN